MNIYYLVTQQVLKAIVAYSFSTQLVFLSSVVARIVQFQITQDCAEDKPYQEWPQLEEERLLVQGRGKT